MTLTQHGLPVLYALFLWWFSTGLILYLDGLPRRTFGWTMLGATALAATALALVGWDAADETVFGAYLGFTCGLTVWAWNEVAFLLGYLSGPNREPCPEGLTGWARLKRATATILYHELAIVAGGVLLIAVTWNAADHTAVWTYLVLWAMRLSTKINVFLGVPNLAEEFLPAHLAFLPSYFRRRPMNLYFPVAVTASTVLLLALILAAADPAAGPHATTSLIFLATLVALALLEHWFLVLPLPSSALWSWSIRSRDADTPPLSPGVTVCSATPNTSAPTKIWSRS